VRRSRRCEHAMPRGDFIARQAGFGNRRKLRQDRAAPL
jgi:hypothetical protein